MQWFDNSILNLGIFLFLKENGKMTLVYPNLILMQLILK